MLVGHQSDQRHQLLGGAKAGEVADLRGDAKRGQRVDAAQTAQLGDQLPPRAMISRLANRGLQLLDAMIDQVDGVEVGIEGVLLCGVVEPLL